MVSINYFGLKKKIRKIGFKFYREAKGSHEVWYNEKLNKTIILPNHGSKDMKKGTLNSIIKASGLTTKEFWEL